MEQTAFFAEQDALVEKIVTLFQGAKVIDRRRRASHGYRAVHVIVRIDGRMVEIQVRTKVQDLWAQAMEKLADEVGREIRYGGVPENRAESVQELKETARLIAEQEEMLEQLREMELGLPWPRQAPVAQRELLLHRLRLMRLRAKLRDASRAVRAILDRIVAG